MKEIQRTKNYSIFKKKQENRPLDPLNLKKLIASLRVRNLMNFHPVLVNRNMEVIDGQHRIEAAKQLGLEVFYVIDEEATDEDMILINTTFKKWDLNDFLNYYIAKGNLEYLKLKEYADSKGLPIHEISRLVTGGKNRFSRDFKDGKFKFFAPGDIEETDKNLENMEAVSSLIKRYVFTNNKFVDQKKFRVALYSFLRRKDVNVEKFMNKLTVKSDSIHPCHDSRGYYIMFRDIYNYNNRNPLTEEQV